MTKEAIEYFKLQRKIFCEEHLKICPKDSIAYQATLKEKEFYDMAIKALEQEPNTWSLDDAREDFTYDVYNTLAFLSTNEEANRIIDSFDRVTSGIRQEPVLDKIRTEIAEYGSIWVEYTITGHSDRDIQNLIEGVLKQAKEQVLNVIDKYKAESVLDNGNVD